MTALRSSIAERLFPISRGNRIGYKQIAQSKEENGYRFHDKLPSTTPSQLFLTAASEFQYELLHSPG
jgi:hypothetical protein